MSPNSFRQSSPSFSRTAIAWASLGLWHASCFLVRAARRLMAPTAPNPWNSVETWRTGWGDDRHRLPCVLPRAAEIAGAGQHDENASVASRRPWEGALRILVAAQQNRRANVEQRACWVVTGCGREPGGTRVAESGPCVIAKEPAAKRPRLPYPVCLAVESANGDSLRKVVRQLVEEAL